MQIYIVAMIIFHAYRYDTMMACWTHLPHERPTFSDLVITVNTLLEKLAGYIDFSHFQTEQQHNNLTDSEKHYV